MSVPIKLSHRPTREFWEIEVLHEDDALLALDKPSGLLTTPDPANADRPSLLGLLSAGLRAGAAWATSRGLTFLAAAHPLDAEATGVLLLAKNKPAQSHLANQFGANQARQVCVALAQGGPVEDVFTVDAPLAPDPARPGWVRVDPRHGRRAVTQFAVLERFKEQTLLRCEPRTQREHRIRVHLRSWRLPITGDKLYGGHPLLLSRLKPGYRFKPERDERPLIQRVALHAEELRVRQPATLEPVTVRAPWPKDLTVAVKYLRRYALGIPGPNP